ncbi:MAG: DUF4230 domain-containing protein [Gemmatimonadetes bacterium]|nr:DUF4230 domain-containing protein [Gemmatimonadota bacterium]NIQ58464.1 DUF4230 domain-containing protein [Gemmatimonadota bacterium]NIU73706.1 DUF4230 domain-containing protein [Gammaproteobacteria bacterium]NIX47500.1 DUF4230 domain-containing protein [Gemmatimonadota bacterium]NIY08070.1 DUF4230 domain-containing protein [Gemmatimonadota bacterium]
MRRLITFLAGVTLVLVLGLTVGTLLERARPSDEAIREALFTAIQREAPEAFLVTGRLEVTTTTRVENSKVFLPGVLGIDLGTARATVRVPGRVSYGFHADSLRPDMVRLLEDGAVEVEIPPLAVYSAEPDLSALEVETERGWARLGSTEAAVERRALAIVTGALRRQGLAHLRSSYQPRINTARALERILGPALVGLGMESPEFRFRVAEDLIVQPVGESP